MEAVIIFIFTVWLIACILYVIFNKQLAKYTKRWDIFRLISAYQLFVNTSKHYRLFYRDNPAISVWKEIPLNTGIKWYHPIWFPESFFMCIINSMVDDLVKFVKASQNTPAMNNVSERFIYQTILRYVHRFPASKISKELQFKIEETNGFTDGQTPLYIFISHFHQR